METETEMETETVVTFVTRVIIQATLAVQLFNISRKSIWRKICINCNEESLFLLPTRKFDRYVVRNVSFKVQMTAMNKTPHQEFNPFAITKYGRVTLIPAKPPCMRHFLLAWPDSSVSSEISPIKPSRLIVLINTWNFLLKPLLHSKISSR